MWEGPPPPELRSFRSMSRARASSLRRGSRSISARSPTSPNAPSSTTPATATTGGRRESDFMHVPLSSSTSRENSSLQQQLQLQQKQDVAGSVSSKTGGLDAGSAAGAQKVVSLSLETTPMSPWSEEEPQLPYPM